MSTVFWRQMGVLGLTLLAGAPVLAAGNSLTLASTDWCPYVCSADAQRPGIVTEYLTELLARQGMALKVEHYPWSRAVYLASRGSVDGLLTAAPGEAPGMLFAQQPTWTYQVCFFTRTDSPWLFHDTASLRGRSLAYMQGYAYGPALDRYLSDPANAAGMRPISGNQVTDRLIAMLRAGRVDSIVEDRLVMGWSLRGQPPLREAGCMAPQPFYLALTPGHAANARLLVQLESALADPQNQARLSELAGQYLQSP